MRLGRLPEPTGDARADALHELRWAMAGGGLTVEKLQVMAAARRTPRIAAALAGVAPHDVPRTAYDVLVAAVHELGDGLQARLLRNALAIGYAGSAKDLTARRLEYVQAHNAAARAAGSRNLLPGTTRALYAIEQQSLDALVTALGTPAVDVAAPGPAVVPRQLPAAPGRFAGRADALGWLDARAFGPECDAAPAVLAIRGTAGVGKTALALHWAHHVTDRFPDGQLYVDLRGHSRGGEPVTPTAALSRLLTALGVAPEAVPGDEEHLAGAYRSATAGRRLLIVLDNAATTEQVAPLVPGTPGCVVVVTSRNVLPGLAVEHGAHVLTLDVLTPADAAALLDGLLGAERTGADPGSAATVAALCGYLPLALRIVAAKILTDPDATLAGMAARLRESDRLSTLGFDDSGVAVRAAFELSYGSLADDARHAFRMIGLVPGTDVTADAVAALLGIGAAAAERLLDRLAAGHLLARSGPGRFQMHDLLRDYAAELCLATEAEPERHAALTRLVAYYVHRSTDATMLLNPASLRLPDDLPDAPRPEPLPDRDAAVGWFAAEWATLTATVVRAVALGHVSEGWQLAYAMRGCFLVGICGADWLPVGQAGLAAATGTGHHQAAAAMHNLLGRAYRRLGDLTNAAHHTELSLEMARTAGWPRGETIAHCMLGGIRQDQGLLAAALTHHEAALALERSYGDPAGGMIHLANIGSALYQIGRYSDAAEYFANALDIVRRKGDERGVAIVSEALGAINHQFLKLDEAVTDVDRALAAFRRLGFRDLEAECLSTLARIRCDLGDAPGARAYGLASARLARSLGDVRVEVIAANTLGEVALRAGDPAEAARRHRAAHRHAGRIGYPVGRIGALAGLAAATVAGGDAAAGERLARDAVAAATDGGFLGLEARSLTVLGSALLASGDRAGAAEAGNRALDLYLTCGSRLGAADAEKLLAALG